MTLLFDTSALSHLLGEDQAIVKQATNPVYDTLLIPLAADAELRFGYANGSKEEQNLVKYQDFRARFGLRLHLPDEVTSQTYASLAAWCRKHGISLSNDDLWISSTTIQTGGSLLALDKDFTRVPQVNLVTVR